ncbi:MAG: Slp/YeaY family lipoprotein [Xanthomonadaceae bacterium]|nr:Slp/YeaY family lipoprotein [Xanthomonadaceae bacterium]
MRWLLPLALAIGLAGCASKLPQPIREAPEPDLALRVAVQDPERYFGRQVRWGGSIAGVDNRAEETCLEVVGRELQSSGKPVAGNGSPGRFLACTGEFLDPVVYAEGRLVTVAGTLEAVETRLVGKYPYRYPVVQVSALHLWAPEPERVIYEPDPFWYDPFWPWPYYRHPRYAPPGWYGYPYWW